MTNPSQRFTVGLVPSLPPTPATPPLPHAAADTAAEAGETGERLTLAEAPSAITAALDLADIVAAGNFDDAELGQIAEAIRVLAGRLRDTRAERDKWRAVNNRVDLTTERGLALAVDNLREISDMLVANGVTALPFPAPNATARNLRAIADALAALATATPTPPAAEAGTGGDRHKDALNALCSLGVAAGNDATFRRAAAAGLAAWAVGRDARAAIDAALDQEADHAQ